MCTFVYPQRWQLFNQRGGASFSSCLFISFHCRSACTQPSHERKHTEILGISTQGSLPALIKQNYAARLLRRVSHGYQHQDLWWWTVGSSGIFISYSPAVWEMQLGVELHYFMNKSKLRTPPVASDMIQAFLHLCSNHLWTSFNLNECCHSPWKCVISTRLLRFKWNLSGSPLSEEVVSPSSSPNPALCPQVYAIGGLGIGPTCR